MVQKNEQKIAFVRTCRGKGKIYTAFSIPGEIECDAVWAESTTKQGKRVPARVLRLRDNLYLLVLPILTVSQRCRIVVTDRQGGVVSEAFHAVSPRGAQLRSAANSLRNDAMAVEIRDYDERAGNGGLSVHLDRIICPDGPGFILHGSLNVQGALCERFEEDARFEILDSKGENALDNELIIMRDLHAGHPRYPDVPLRSIQFSARLKNGVNSLVFFPSYGDVSDSVPFVVVEQAEFAQLQMCWHQYMQSGISDAEYDTWFRSMHAVSPVELGFQSARSFPLEPRFSIVVPLYHTPTDFLDEMVESVVGQSYGKLELVLVNSTPDDAMLSERVDTWSSLDDRISVVQLSENRGITENTNAGIAVATGDFLCFLDHDDLLTPDALYCYAEALNEYPDTDLLYSDEDKIEGGYYRDPYFKPDWDPELITGMNYVCHFLCVRKSIVDSLEPASSEYDGAQDHHMTLRVSEWARNVHHVRRVLYHWRVVPASTAAGLEAKPYAIEAGRNAVQSYLDRSAVKGRVTSHPAMPIHYEVLYETPGNPLVSIIIPDKGNKPVLERCLRSIVERSTYDNFEILIIENNSSDAEAFAYYEEAKARDDRIRVEQFDGEFNLSCINNFGVEHARGNYLLMLSSNTKVITSDWLERMLGICMLDGVGAVGAKLHCADGTVRHAGIVGTMSGPRYANRYLDRGQWGYFGTAVMRHDLNAVTAACLMTKREAFERVGGMDDRFSVDYYDVDFCYALRDAGYRVVFEPGARLYHYESVSRELRETDEGKLLSVRDEGLLRQKWPKRYQYVDGYMNPNFEWDNAYYRGLKDLD